MQQLEILTYLLLDCLEEKVESLYLYCTHLTLSDGVQVELKPLSVKQQVGAVVRFTCTYHGSEPMEIEFEEVRRPRNNVYPQNILHAETLRLKLKQYQNSDEQVIDIMITPELQAVVCRIRNFGGLEVAVVMSHITKGLLFVSLIGRSSLFVHYMSFVNFFFFLLNSFYFLSGYSFKNVPVQCAATNVPIFFHFCCHISCVQCSCCITSLSFVILYDYLKEIKKPNMKKFVNMTQRIGTSLAMKINSVVKMDLVFPLTNVVMALSIVHTIQVMNWTAVSGIVCNSCNLTYCFKNNPTI